MMDSLKKIFWSRHTVIGIPYIWLFLFFAFPFALVFLISFSVKQASIPPFAWLYEYSPDDNLLTLSLHLENYFSLVPWYQFEGSFFDFHWVQVNELFDALYGVAYINSIRLAFWSTVFCLLFGYPIAYAISRTAPATQSVLLTALILPSWTSFVIRIYAWLSLLKSNGLINNFLAWANLIPDDGSFAFWLLSLVDMQPIDGRLPLLYTDFSVYVGIVYIYLPFMVFPIFTNLVKLDNRYLEASADLGARPWKTFLTVTLPLSKGGIIAGSMLVFIPAVGEYVIPNILGGPDQLMIGRVLGDEFFVNADWPRASAISVIMLSFLLIPIVYFHKTQLKEMEEGRA
jgi:putrescine transport system permease protein